MKRLVIILLALLMLAQLCACAAIKEPAESGVDSQTVNESDSGSQAEEQSPVPNIDFGGVDLKILVRSESLSDSYTLAYKTTDFYADELNSDILNNAIYYRNLAVSEKFNINVITEQSNDIDGAFTKALISGDNEYDYYSLSLRSSFTFISSGYLLALNDLPHVDFSNSWWMTDAMNDSSIGGDNYFALGDMSANSYISMGCIFFSKSLIDKYSLESPYTLVHSGEWTIDKMLEMSGIAADDLNGDSAMNENDQYGIASNVYMWEPLFYGTGKSFTSKDENGFPVYNKPDEAMYNILNKIWEICNDKATFLAEDKYNYLPNHRDYAGVIFSEDRTLFAPTMLGALISSKGNEADFGFVPTPKWDESQENYYMVLHNTHARALAIPVIAPEERLDMYGAVLEEIAYRSQKIIYPAFVETLLEDRLSRDEEASAMIKVLTSHIRVDIMLSDTLSTLNNSIRGIMKSPFANFTSMFAANASIFDKALEGLSEGALKSLSE